MVDDFECYVIEIVSEKGKKKTGTVVAPLTISYPRPHRVVHVVSSPSKHRRRRRVVQPPWCSRCLRCRLPSASTLSSSSLSGSSSWPSTLSLLPSALPLLPSALLPLLCGEGGVGGWGVLRCC